jgi:hypothetical protein
LRCSELPEAGGEEGWIVFRHPGEALLDVVTQE